MEQGEKRRINRWHLGGSWKGRKILAGLLAGWLDGREFLVFVFFDSVRFGSVELVINHCIAKWGYLCASSRATKTFSFVRSYKKWTRENKETWRGGKSCESWLESVDSQK